MGYIPKGFRKQATQEQLAELLELKDKMTPDHKTIFDTAMDNFNSGNISIESLFKIANDIERGMIFLGPGEIWDPSPKYSQTLKSTDGKVTGVFAADGSATFKPVEELDKQKALYNQTIDYVNGKIDLHALIAFASNKTYDTENYDVLKAIRSFNRTGMKVGDLQEILRRKMQGYYHSEDSFEVVEKPDLEYDRNETKILREVAEVINHPSHYTQYKGVEVIDITEQLNFNRGNAVKYIARAGFKSEDTEIQDLQKAKWYVEREISRMAEGGGEYENTADATALVEQMIYNRGTAVAFISHAGTGDPGSTASDLYKAVICINRELTRLENYKES